MTTLKTGVSIFLLTLVSLLVYSEDTEAEIEYLLGAIGQSSCTFIRNNKEHSAAEAEDHLRMKYRRGKKWVNSAEQFIKRIATKSSWSNNPYYIRCPESELKPTDEWMSQKLATFRNSKL